MSRYGKIIMFIASYVPLYIILIILNFDFHGACDVVTYLFTSDISISSILSIIRLWSFADMLVFVLIVLTVLSIMSLSYLLKAVDDYKEDFIIADITDKNHEILNYLLVYILSFINSSFSDFTTSNKQSITAFILMISTIGYLYIKNNMIYINPTLSLLYKYNVYEVKTPSNTIILLSKKDINKMKKLKGTTISANPVENNFYIQI